ncbi:MAG: TetR/AcrR family transcriptional regulator, partial [Burkholderiales bacterium]
MTARSKKGRKPLGRPPLSSDQVEVARKRIADAARRLFRDEGFEAVSMRRLATEAGCTPMSLYTYFDGKIDVLRSVWGDV